MMQPAEHQLLVNTRNLTITTILILITLWLDVQWSLTLHKFSISIFSVLYKVAQVLTASSAPVYNVVNLPSLWPSYSVMSVQ